MKRIILLSLLFLTGCTDQGVQNFARQIQAVNQQYQAQQQLQAQKCGAIDLPPMANIGCRNVCINGSWAEVCG